MDTIKLNNNYRRTHILPAIDNVKPVQKPLNSLSE